MEKSTTLEFDYDEQHNPEGLDYASPEEEHAALEDELSVTESSSTSGYENALPDAEGSPDGIFWGILAAFCFLAGLSIGLVLYFKSSFALTVAGWLRRCCPKISRDTAQDPVLLTVLDRKSKERVENDGAKDEQKSDESSSDEGKSDEKCKDCVGDSDGAGASADQGKEPEVEQKGGEATAGGNNEENENANAGKEANEACENDRNTSSSSSSSSENEGNEDDEKKSVRHRKKVAAETTEGEAAAPESEDKDKDKDEGDGEHKE